MGELNTKAPCKSRAESPCSTGILILTGVLTLIHQCAILLAGFETSYHCLQRSQRLHFHIIPLSLVFSKAFRVAEVYAGP